MKLHIHKPFDLAIFTSRFFPKRNENIDPLKKNVGANVHSTFTHFILVESLSHVRLLPIPYTAVHPASLVLHCLLEFAHTHVY